MEYGWLFQISGQGDCQYGLAFLPAGVKKTVFVETCGSPET
jgi:hypothetical protein